MTAEFEHDLKAGRRQVARSRGALSGVLLIVLGAWAALIPFIGPYLDLGFAPSPDSAWHWTSGRGLYQLLPGAVAALAGLLLMVSASRATTLLAGWLGAVAGAWLVVTPSLSSVLNVDAGSPDPASGDAAQAAQALLQVYGIGAAILFVASLALGRLSVHSVRDVRAAERRAEHEAALEAEQQRRLEDERLAEQQRRVEEDRRAAGQAAEASDGPHQPQHGLPQDDRPAQDGFTRPIPPVHSGDQPPHQGSQQGPQQGEPQYGSQYGPPQGPPQGPPPEGPPQGPPPQRYPG